MFTEDYLLKNPEWKQDVIPELWQGKNIADFIDPDIEEKLEALEREEERLQAEGFYDSDEDSFDSDDEREAVEAQANLKAKITSQAIKKSKRNQPPLPRTAGLRTLSELSAGMRAAGHDPSRIEGRAKALAKAQKRKRDEEGEEDVEMGSGSDGDEDDAMDVDGEGAPVKRARTAAGAVTSRRAPRTNRSLAGLRDDAQADKAVKLRNIGQRPAAFLARAGEGDRHIGTKMPRHLFAGKRKGGKTQRR